MPVNEHEALLAEVLELLCHPSFVPSRDQCPHWTAMKARIEASLTPLGAVPHPAITFLQRQLTSSPALRVLPDERQVMEHDDAIWVRGFIRVDRRDLATFIDQRIERMRKALADLPEITRAVFLAHCHDETPYQTIASQLAISVADVERELSAALISLDRALD